MCRPLLRWDILAAQSGMLSTVIDTRPEIPSYSALIMDIRGGAERKVAGSNADATAG